MIPRILVPNLNRCLIGWRSSNRRRITSVSTTPASLWASSYAEVRKEMRARYPRHPWPEHPASAVATLKYVDGNGTQQPLAASKYQTDFKSEPARIKPAFGEVWPDIRFGDFNVIEVTYTAGYGATSADTPQQLKDACFLLIKDWYDLPGATTDRKRIEVPFGVYALLDAHRVPVPV